MPYESEQGDPKTALCTCMSGKEAGKGLKLLFDGHYLKMHLGGVVDSAQHARSGLPVGSEFDYSVERQKEKEAGPIPEGEYWITPSELRSPSLTSPLFLMNTDSWGHHRISIHKYPGTNTHGRGGFFIHGGDKFGSKGCIDLAGFMGHFVRRLNELVPTRVVQVPQRVELKPTCYIPLTVKYPSQRVDMPPWFNK